MRPAASLPAVARGSRGCVLPRRPRRVLVVDHRDSFTFNLVQAFLQLGASVTCERHDRLTREDVERLAPTHVVSSPGPGHPARLSGSRRLLEGLLGRVPVLGVCLGHQLLALALGARVTRAAEPHHGLATRVFHDGRTLHAGLPQGFAAGRYHSLAVPEEALGAGLEVTAHSPAGEVLGVRAPRLCAEGLQFHPESVLTPAGPRLLGGFLRLGSGSAEVAR